MKVYSDVLIGGEYGFDLPFAPKTIVDAGANIGMASIFFARRYPGAKIIAIEPEASNFSLLMRNVRAYSAIVPIHAALWNRDGQISVGDPDPETGAGGKWAFVTREGPGAKVRAVTMPTLMQEMGVRTIDLAKIDIEGAEQELFQDTKWLAGTECVMIGLHDRFRPGCSEVVNSAMQGFTRMHRSETDFYLRGTRSGIPH
jgi:FkbM family methyltransferase